MPGRFVIMLCMDLRRMAILKEQLDRAVTARVTLMDPDHHNALRLFNGFYEGHAELVADVYGRTLVLYGYASTAEQSLPLLAEAQTYLLARLDWLECAIQKVHAAPDTALRRGRITSGGKPDSQVS
jgi:23S rRNA (cytosine1962-C5)-methyltransferase